MNIPPMNKHNKTLLRMSDGGLSFTSQYLLVTSYDMDYSPVNYLVPSKPDSRQLAAFLCSFENPVQVEWCTVYDTPMKHRSYENQTYYLMCIRETDGFSWHAIPMFTDMALRFNTSMTKRRCLNTVIAQGSELTEEEYELLDGLNIIDDTFATLCHHNTPKRSFLRTVITGSCFKGKRFQAECMTMHQVVNGQVFPLAFIPKSMGNNFVAEDKQEIMTDYEVHKRILRYMKFPY